MQDSISIDEARDPSAAAKTLKAVWLFQPPTWMAGAIKGADLSDNDQRQTLVSAVIDSIEPVQESELPYSTCTDGRQRDALLDGQAVPVREQLVGTDTMAAFVAAEALGERFYSPEELQAPVADRIAKVVQFLESNGYRPTAHISCGAAGGFLAVLGRATECINDAHYVERLKQLLPEGMYDADLHQSIVGGYQRRLDSAIYDGYRDGLVCEIAEGQTGQHGIEKYIDDGQGVHGHKEQAIVYLDQTIKGMAVNPNKLIAAHGVQVFAVNSSRADAIARLFSRGGDNETDYLTARLAIEDFAAAGHGTLASSMQTVIISVA
jgi:hypothetical protein